MNDEPIVYELDPDVDIDPDDLDPAVTPKEQLDYEVVTEDDVEVDDPDGD